MHFHLITLGCPKNSVDSEMMAELLRQRGHVPVEQPRRADVILVNTCGFIEAARQESYEALRALAAQKRRGQMLIATGCLAQRFPAELRSRVPQLDGLIGARAWPRIAELLEHLLVSRGAASGDMLVEDNLVTSVPRCLAQPTAYLKIADGCDAACSFCAIPLIKGPQRSKPLEDVLRETRELAQQGVREIVLIAQDTTAYGRDLGDAEGFPGLLRAIAPEMPRESWIRILYAYPQHITPALIESMVAIPQVCHYLDLPLQHGHPDVLRRMRRPHGVEEVYALLDALRQAMPDIALRTSLIVGFPGETDAEFEALLDFLRAAQLDKVGVFGYSAEQGTLAAALPDRVPAALIEERRERAMLVQQEISRQRNRAQVGRTLRVLVEGVGDGVSIGRSYRDAPEIDGMVLMTSEQAPGEFVEARIVGAQEYDLIGEALPRVTA